jgi:CheY-like chemotaxis protein
VKRIAILAIGSASEGSLNRADVQSEQMELRCVGTIEAAQQVLESGFAPALIVVSERWPGETQPADLRQLQEVAPLARIWRNAGPWCEGEMRTAPPAIGTLRSYSHQTDVRLADELVRWISGTPARAMLPATTTDEEITLALAEHPTAESSFVVVHAVEREAGLALLDPCELCGYRGVWNKELRDTAAIHPCAVLCDIRVDELSTPTFVTRSQALFGTIPVIAVVGFPRPHDISTARANGFSALISKPLALSDLAWHLRNARSIGVC